MIRKLLAVTFIILLSCSTAFAQEAEPVNAEPATPEPVSAEPVIAEPVAAEPVAAEPVAAEPVAAEPIAAEPVEEQPLEGEQVYSDTAEVEEAKKPFAEGNEFFFGLMGSYVMGKFEMAGEKDYYDLSAGLKAFIEYTPVSFFAVGIMSDTQFIFMQNRSEFYQVNADASIKFMYPSDVTPYVKFSGGYTRFIPKDTFVPPSDDESIVPQGHPLSVIEASNGWNVQPAIGLMWRNRNFGIIFEGSWQHTAGSQRDMLTEPVTGKTVDYKSQVFMISLGFLGIVGLD